MGRMCAGVWRIRPPSVLSRESEPCTTVSVHSSAGQACLGLAGPFPVISAWCVLCVPSIKVSAHQGQDERQREAVHIHFTILQAGSSSQWVLSLLRLFQRKNPWHSSQMVPRDSPGAFHRHVVAYLGPESRVGRN